MIEYPCPECGSDGPHPVIEDNHPQRMIVLAECRDCYAEFSVEL